MSPKPIRWARRCHFGGPPPPRGLPRRPSPPNPPRPSPPLRAPRLALARATRSSRGCSGCRCGAPWPLRERAPERRLLLCLDFSATRSVVSPSDIRFTSHGRVRRRAAYVPCARDAPVRDADARNANVLHQRAEEAREGAWSKCAFWQGPGWLLRRVHVGSGWPVEPTARPSYWGRQPLPGHVEPPCHAGDRACPHAQANRRGGAATPLQPGARAAALAERRQGA